MGAHGAPIAGIWAMKLFSPAKVNLFLRVLNKRPDGYHNLATLMQSIDLCDVITIEKSNQDVITCSDSSIPTDERNLVWKARELYRSHTTSPSFPISIHIEKKIPHGAGLGGGSSNAATVLFGLNAMSSDPVSLSTMQSWSSAIGSDVPFFFSSGTAICRGKGEIVDEIALECPQTIWIAKPPYSLSTPEVYQNLDLTLCDPRDPTSILEGLMQGKNDWCNDLESAAFQIRPELQDFREHLCNQGFEKAMMTGSGSAFICIGQPKFSGFQGWKVGKMKRLGSFWYEKERVDGCA